MLFNWKRNQSKAIAEKDAKGLFSIKSKDGTLIRFEQVSLSPVLHNLSTDIKAGSWVLLFGPEDFAKALFCDLCFSYIQPETGRVSPCLKGSDVTFVGRSNTTYGQTLIDHLSCGVKDRSREKMEAAVSAVFGEKLQSLLTPNSPLVFKDNKKISELDLNEKDYLEIIEANLLLQARKAAIIDTTTDFYQIGLEQGFSHSKFFLESGKTIFWIIDEKSSRSESQKPWLAASGIMKTSLYFSPESPANHIN